MRIALSGFSALALLAFCSACEPKVAAETAGAPSAAPDPLTAAFPSGATPGVTTAVPTNDPGAVTGLVDVSRSGRWCAVKVNLHNGTRYHLQNAEFSLPTLSETFSVGEIIANGDGESEQTFAVGIDDSCKKAAQALAASLSTTKPLVGTCDMEGQAEGDCQNEFVFKPAINLDALDGQIRDLVSQNEHVGTWVSISPSNLAVTEPDGNTPVYCPQSADTTVRAAPDWGSVSKALVVHYDGDGVANWYQIQGACPDGSTLKGWVNRNYS